MIPIEIARTAAERGMKQIAITDHYYPNSRLEDFVALRYDFASAIKTLGIDLEVYIGCEIEIMSPGKHAGSPEVAESLDFVMAGATHFQNVPMTVLPSGDSAFHAQYLLRMFEYAIGLGWVDVIAHPFFVVPGICSPGTLEYLSNDNLQSAIELAKENDVAMEISRRALATPEQLDFSLRFYQLCKNAGLKFTLGSDAHRLEDVGQMHILRALVRELGLTEEHFRLPTVSNFILQV